MRYLNAYSRFIPLLLISLPRLAVSYNGTSCCMRANETHNFADTTDYPLPSHPICGQVYGAYDPAPPVYVSYFYCRENCAGIGLSKVSQPGQWAGPIVQFILPAVIFSSTIPRRRQLTFANTRKLFWGFEDADLIPEPWRKVAQAGLFLMWLTGVFVEMLVIFVDNILWIFAIVTGAGPMLIGGLHEAWLDHYILKSIRRRTKAMRDMQLQDVAEQRELLVMLALGNLTEDGHPIEKTIAKLTVEEEISGDTGQAQVRRDQTRSEAQARLTALLGAQAGFGTAVGAPVLFYLGAFVYTILDLQSDPSDQDSAISLAYGVEWMVIVHVAIVSGCLLAANNPSTSTAIVGQPLDLASLAEPMLVSTTNTAYPIMKNLLYHISDRLILLRKLLVWYTCSDAYDTTFQPVWMWRRGANKRRKIRNKQVWLTPQSAENEKLLLLGHWSWFFIWFSAVVLVAVPPAAGAVVSYKTPPIGVSCRSLSFMIYAGSQVVLCTFYVFRNLWHHEVESDHLVKRLLARRFWYHLPLLFSLFCCIGGTVMQVVGVFRNCFCYTITDKWLRLDQAYVNLASDTEDARGSTANWITMGITATVFMVFTACAGWWYQQFVRRRFLDAVENLYTKKVVEQSRWTRIWTRLWAILQNVYGKISMQFTRRQSMSYNRIP